MQEFINVHKKLMFGYKRTTLRSRDFNVATTKSPTTLYFTHFTIN